MKTLDLEAISDRLAEALALDRWKEMQENNLSADEAAEKLNRDLEEREQSPQEATSETFASQQSLTRFLTGLPSISLAVQMNPETAANWDKMSPGNQKLLRAEVIWSGARQGN